MQKKNSTPAGSLEDIQAAIYELLFNAAGQCDAIYIIPENNLRIDLPEDFKIVASHGNMKSKIVPRLILQYKLKAVRYGKVEGRDPREIRKGSILRLNYQGEWGMTVVLPNSRMDAETYYLEPILSNDDALELELPIEQVTEPINLLVLKDLGIRIHEFHHTEGRVPKQAKQLA